MLTQEFLKSLEVSVAVRSPDGTEEPLVILEMQKGPDFERDVITIRVVVSAPIAT